jgi:hypothetical protein
VKPRLRGEAHEIRFADDAILCFHYRSPPLLRHCGWLRTVTCSASTNRKRTREPTLLWNHYTQYEKTPTFAVRCESSHHHLSKRSAFVSQEKYIGMDVHQATISVAVMDARGKLIMECLLETKTTTIIEFIRGLHGSLSLTSEEGTSAAWLHDLLKPHVSRLVVCDPRKNALLKDGSKSSPLRQPFRCPRLTAGISRTSMGGNIPAIDAAQTALADVCSYACGSPGPFSDQ